ncbi:MAG TPA: hydroxyacid dehydrogenase [Candidatus Merdenecus merdavium]|nr:hydroxyacid dehydrogenase [Candidatus Merdenecus merdavium]
MDVQSISLLESYPEIDSVKVNNLLTEELFDFSPKIVVLDDDPTGVQTVFGVYVYTDWEKDTLTHAFKEENQMFFILTNSRSLSESETVKVHTEIAERLCQVSKEQNQTFLLLSRGDSTLRGHYPLETDTLKETLERNLPYSFNGEVFCPFFPEGGRYTFHNIHYVKEGEHLTPSGNTEFARDQTFSFQSSDLTEYIEEKSKGNYTKESCVVISLEELRSLSFDPITMKLLQMEQFQKVVVNAITYTDLKVFTICWIRAMKKGKHYMARCAAALPKVIGNISDKPFLKGRELIAKGTTNGGLIIIGSHVKKTTEQFKALLESHTPLELLEFNVNSYFKEGGLESAAKEVLTQAEKHIQSGKTVLIYTSRKLLAPKDFLEEELLSLSVKISESLTSIVSMLHVKPSFILAKGGITSSDVGTIGLHVKKALVLGQVKPGIPVWLTGSESKFPNMPYIIFPGNVGTSTTLREIVESLILGGHFHEET